MEKNTLNIFPLQEKNMNSAVKGEIILDPKTAHITIKNEVHSVEKFLSQTKELETELNSLIKMKDEMYLQYENVEITLQEILSKFLMDKKYCIEIRDKLNDIETKLRGLQAQLTLMLNKFSEYYKNHYDFLYNDLKKFMKQLSLNTVKVVKIKFTLDELEFLYNDYKTISGRNTKNLNDIKSFLKGRGVDI